VTEAASAGVRLRPRETARILGGALRYVRPFRHRFAGKAAFTLASVLPVLLVAWPVKMLVDHVVVGTPVEDSITPYPFFVAPFVEPLEGRSPGEVLFWVVAFQIVLIALVGAVGTTVRENDRASSSLGAGHDTATQSENRANLGFTFAGGLLGLLDLRYTLRLSQDLNHHYRSRLFERIQALPITAFDDERIGDAIYRLMYDTPSITIACYRLLLTPVVAPLHMLLVAGMIQVTFGDHPLLVWGALAILPICLVVSFTLGDLFRQRTEESREAGSVTTTTVEEGLGNILAVQSLGGEAHQRVRFDRDSWQSFGAYRRSVQVVLFAVLAGLLPAFVVIGWVFFYVVELVVDGAISVGDVTLLLTFFGQLLFAAFELGGTWFLVQDEAAGLRRVNFLMDLPGEADRPDARRELEVHDGLRFEDVHYAYPDGTEALRGVSFEAPVGAVTALVGPAGAGKSTLAYMVPRFLSPTRGRVCLDGVDLERIALLALRERVAFVFQETMLFDATVEENIRVGNPEADEASVRRAARLAGADGFIRALPEGYRTRLGRGGGRLSVGQKQRLAIARALVRDAPILILDEPTSALDPDTERQLVESLHEAARERLVLVIAHRLSTVRSADRILFLDGGRVVEEGTHAELMARPDGAYRRFVELQTRGAA